AKDLSPRRQKRVRRAKLNRVVQGPIQRAAHRVHAVDALDGFADFLSRHQLKIHVNPADHEYALFFFYFADDFCGETAIAGIDVTRFQRASEGAHHSTGNCGNHIVEGGGVRFTESGGSNILVLGETTIDGLSKPRTYSRSEPSSCT